MNNKFQLGDIVKCTAGGPTMVITSGPFGNANADANGGIIPFYSCTYWNSVHGSFAVHNLPENVIETCNT